MKGNFSVAHLKSLIAFHFGLFGLLGSCIGLGVAHYLVNTVVAQEGFIPVLWVAPVIIGKLIGSKMDTFVRRQK